MNAFGGPGGSGESAPHLTRWRAIGLAAALVIVGTVVATATSATHGPSPSITSTTTPAPSAGSPSASASLNPTLSGYTFDDEFDGTAIGSVWTHDFGFGGTENSWSSTQSSVANGVLTITAQRIGTGWASDVLDTKTTWTQQYGYFEARMKIPEGDGLWPAFWLYASQHGQPEIDVMEVCGSPPGSNGGDDASLLHSTLHWSRRGQETAHLRSVDLSLDFHVYAVDWRPDHIAFLLDGVEVARFTDASHFPATPLPLVLDLAVGGSFCGPSTALTPSPSVLQVDWVRVRP